MATSWRSSEGGATPPLVSGVTAVLTVALTAALWTVTLIGRTSLGGLSVRWAGTFLLVAGALLGWTLLSRRPALTATGLLPSAVASAVVLAVLYASDTAYHAYVYGPWWRGAALPASVALVLAAPVFAAAAAAWRQADSGARAAAAREEARTTLGRHAVAIATATLLAAGALQALSYSAVATDDLIRYWSVVDAVAAGYGYPVSTGAAGGAQFYLIELPGYPALIAAGFGIAGHRFLALQLPLALANLALPVLSYGLAREAGATRWWATWLSLALVCLPFYQVYALGAPEPEPLLAAALAGMLLLALRRRWLGAGLTAGAAVLLRPEGLLYAGALFGALALHYRLRDRGWLRAAAACAVPVAAFSLFLLARFGVPWPAGWANVAGPQYLEANWRLVLRQNLPHYAAVMGLPAPEVSGLLLGVLAAGVTLAGLLRLWRTRPEQRFVPLAVLLAGGANLAVIMLSPTYLSADLFSPPTFFRHVSIVFPWLVPAYAVLLPARRRSRAPLALAALAVLALELAVLAAGTGRPSSGPPGILTSDPTVLLADLRRSADTLPRLPFRRAGDAGQVTVDPAFDYLGFREGLFGAVRPYDLRVNDAGHAYLLATGLISLAGLGALAVARRP